MKNRIAIVTCASVLATGAASAQVHPVLERGFSPENVYQVGSLDSINTFNGNLSLSIPIGGTYPVGGRLSYRLTLVYNSSFWDNATRWEDAPRNCPRGPGHCMPRRAIPTPFDTAGVGWRLSLGDLAAPHSLRNRSPNWLYVAPDGSRHAFVDTLHEGDPARPDAWYTRDNTYMRLRQVEPPWSGGFPWMELKAADGIERVFHFDGEDWRLSTVRDAFGNSLDITYDDGLWTLTDTVGRTQRVFWTTVADRHVVARVELTAFGTSDPAVYSFGYANDPDGLDIDESCVDARLGHERLRVPLLTTLTLPDGSQYRMVDWLGEPGYHLTNGYGDTKAGKAGVVRRSPASPKKTDPVYYGCVPLSGELRRLIVPTGAVYQWTHGPVRHPNGSGGCTAERDRDLDPALSTTSGVTERTISLDRLDAATWSYEYSIPDDPDVTHVSRTVTSPDGHDTVYHFNTEPCAYDGGERVGWGGWAYGLPFTPSPGSDPKPSVEYYEGHGAGRVLKKARLVRYEHDQLPELTEGSLHSWYSSNRRLAETLVVHYDDPAGVTWSTSFSRSSNFDGLGHYRRVDRGGFGVPDTRTEVTRFNPTRGTYSIDGDNNPTGSFAMLSPDDPWVLNTYDLARQTEGAVTAKQEFCFDTDTGLLERQRTFVSGTSRSPHDLMAAFEYDLHGNLTEEDLHGGDRQSIGTGSVCGWSLPAPESGLVHEYAYGARKKTTHLGTSVHALDVDIDWRTGLVERSRDVSGFGTNWEYDALGQVTALVPDQGGQVRVQHVPASGDAVLGLTPARIDVVYRNGAGSTTLAAETFQFDAVGRLSSEGHLLPDNTWSTKHTEYSKTGKTRRVSEWTEEGASAAWTVFSDYDAFGRARRVTTPDGRSTDFGFTGERVRARTVSIATGGTGSSVIETPFTTTTHLDFRGRVTDVWEPISSADEVHSGYEYDIGGRLSRVTVEAPEGTQTREFEYDHRGFLNGQRLPEKGASGNGVVTFGDYDARGNAWTVDDGTNHLAYTWDATNRLTRIAESDGAQRLLEEREYGEDNAATNLKRGKLIRAVRHNYFDGARDYQVEEGYEYRELGGRLSKRSTMVGVVGEGREATFEEWFNWNDLGALASHRYPELNYVAPPRVVSYQYTSGFLTSIPGYAPSITYHPNGTRWRTTHGHGVVDEQLLDSTGMARPGRIRTLYAQKNWNSGTFHYDGAGNIVRMGNDWFRYDGLGRVTEGTAVRADGVRGRQTYRYDGFGNLDRIWTAGLGYRYAKTSPTTNRITAASYDSAGNQISWGSGPLLYQYTSSPFNQIHLINGGSPPVTRFYGYTADGERIASYASDTDVITHAFRDLDGRVVREYEQVSYTGAWSWKRDLVWGGNGLLATIDAQGTTRHHHVDHLGSPRLVTDSKKFEEARQNYYPFGEEATDPFADPNRIKFTGHERDLNLDGQTTDDLDYMHARFFNPNLGRFLSVDPVGGQTGLSQSFNGYTYALDNPVNLVDPFGLSGREFHGEITVTARYPRIDVWWPIWTVVHRPTITDRLRAEPRVRRGEDLVQAIGDNFTSDLPPCSENFREAFSRSFSQANSGPARLGGAAFRFWFSLKYMSPAITGLLTAEAPPASALAVESFVAQRGLMPSMAYVSPTGAGSFFTAGAATAAAFYGGLAVGTAINIQLVEMIQSPCQRTW